MVLIFQCQDFSPIHFYYFQYVLVYVSILFDLDKKVIQTCLEINFLISQFFEDHQI